MAHRLSVSLVLVIALVVPMPAFASNEALLKLLQVLRDRGSISAEEYEDIRQTAEASTEAVTPAATPAETPRPAASPAVYEPRQPGLMPAAYRTLSFEPYDAAIGGSPFMGGRDDAPPTDLSAQTQGTKPQPEGAPQQKEPPAQPAERPWFQRLSLRGYTQFRYTKADEDEGPALEVPADRSVNENESFIIRRGRLVLSGDVTDRLSLYLQTEHMGSTGAADFSMQLRDLYGDFFLNKEKTFRVRLGQSKIPYGWVNLQSSQNRAPMERPDGINSAAEGERDLGAYLMWASTEARTRFRDLTARGLKGSGDYGVVAVGAYAGQGPNRSDQNGDPYVLARLSYPFKLSSGQFFELGAQGYYGKFVPQTAAITVDGTPITPSVSSDGIADTRFGATAVWYPQPFGVEAEWNVGRGPELSEDFRTINRESLNGGYVQFNYRNANSLGTWFPFARWNYFDGARKFGRNAPRTKVNEVDFGLEFAKWAELELALMYTRTIDRTRTGSFPYSLSKDGNRIGFQVQWNY